MWPFKRKNIEPPIRPPAPWVETSGVWHKMEECHCGQTRHYQPACLDFPVAYDVCPKCGHTDKWETFIGRYITEVREETGVFGNTVRRTRNQRTERWTPDHCPIKETPDAAS